jgi:hypothetical protein
MALLLYFAIERLGMIGAILTAVAVNFVQTVAVACSASKVVGARVSDLRLFADFAKVTVAAVAVAAVSSFILGFIAPDLLLLRLAAGCVCVGALYGTGMWLFRLPGSEYMSRARLADVGRTALARLRRAG